MVVYFHYLSVVFFQIKKGSYLFVESAFVNLYFACPACLNGMLCAFSIVLQFVLYLIGVVRESGLFILLYLFSQPLFCYIPQKYYLCSVIYTIRLRSLAE